MSELQRCKKSIRGIEFSLVLYLIAVIIFSTVAYKNLTPTISSSDAPAPTLDKHESDKIIAGSVLLFFAMIIMLISILSATSHSCFKTAISGSILFFLLL